ncbi:MAG: hypothetical protein EH225_10625, partial [Calditrichaeota bacterium]
SSVKKTAFWFLLSDNFGLPTAYCILYFVFCILYFIFCVLSFSQTGLFSCILPSARQIILPPTAVSPAWSYHQ